MSSDQIVTIIIALIGSAGLWTYLSTTSKNAHERALRDASSRAEFSETLREQVERLAAKLDEKTDQIEQLLKDIAELRSQLTGAQTTIAHLERTLIANGHTSP